MNQNTTDKLVRHDMLWVQISTANFIVDDIYCIIHNNTYYNNTVYLRHIKINFGLGWDNTSRP